MTEHQLELLLNLDGASYETAEGYVVEFTSVSQLLEDFWREVKRVMDEKGIPNDL